MELVTTSFLESRHWKDICFKKGFGRALFERSAIFFANISQTKNLDQCLTKRYLLSRKLLISCQGFKVVIKIRSELQRSSLLGHSTTTWTKSYPILTPSYTGKSTPLEWTIVDILHDTYPLSYDQAWTFYWPLPPSPCPRSYWMTPYWVNLLS